MQAEMNDVTQPETMEKIGETASFPYDRMTVERFRLTFPRARWSDARKAWFVPGKTAAKRIDRWLADEASKPDTYADNKGRDAYAFDPIESPYLQVAESGFRIRTPFSRTVVAELREIPWAHWDGDLRVWQVPFRSYEHLRHHWSAIEAAAKRNEPEERKRRAAERKDTVEGQASAQRSAERQRRRYPVPMDDLPPFGQPVETTTWGIVVFSGSTGEFVEPDAASGFYPSVSSEHVWASWRTATIDELVKTWPAKNEPLAEERVRGWWQPTINVLRDARRTARRTAQPK